MAKYLILAATGQIGQMTTPDLLIIQVLTWRIPRA